MCAYGLRNNVCGNIVNTVQGQFLGSMVNALINTTEVFADQVH